MMTELESKANSLFIEGKGSLRRGQCYMNALYDLNPSLYEEITGSKIDPFYVDDKIPAFLNYLYEVAS